MEAPVEAPVEANAVRDVTAVKRTAPLDSKRLDRRDCTWSSEGKTSAITYGPQVRFGPVYTCAPGTEACSQSVAITYTSSVSNSFGATVSAGVSLFQIISSSVEFTTTYTEEQSTAHSWTHDLSIPAGQKAFLTFRPKIECKHGPSNLLLKHSTNYPHRLWRRILLRWL